MIEIGTRPGGPPASSAPPRPDGSRGSWHLRANAVVVAWLAAAVPVALVHGLLPAPRWLLIHVFLLGAVTNAIVIWSEHFTVTLLRVPSPPGRPRLSRLAALNAGAVAVLYGVAAGPWPVAAAGAGVVVAVVGWHTAVLARLPRRALPGRFGHVIPWYVAAGAALAAGGVLGGLMVSPAATPRLHAAHAVLNLFGWVGLTVLGTLFTLWPTVLRTRLSELTRRSSIVALRTAVPALAIAVAGLLLGLRWVAAAGLAGYAAGSAIALVPLVETVRRRRPHTAASWMLAASVVWFAVALAVAVVVTATRDRPGDALGPLLPLVLAGFVAQVLLGSLTHLLPVVLGGGPARLKENAALMERGWVARLAAINLAVPLLAVPVPGPLRTAGWAMLVAAVAAFAVLALWALAAARFSGRIPVVLGAAIGCVVTAAAVVVAVSGSGPAAPVQVGGGTQTIEVTLSGMRIRPAAIEAPPGTRLVLRVVNKDAQRHDVRLSTGAATPLLDPGGTAVLEVPALTAPIDGWCTVAGHRAAGMTMRITPTGPGHAMASPGTPAGDTSAGHSAGHDGAPLDLTAGMSAGWRPYDAALRPAPGGTEHKVRIEVTDADLEVAPGVRQRMWTFNGTVPGPVLRGKVGDVFTVTFVNGGTMAHGIDFHAGAVAPDRVMRSIEPGERLTYRFRADHAGAWLYHCSTMPMSLHIANGMYGAVIIDPPGLAKVDREYLLVAGELYLGPPGDDAHAARIRDGRPDGWMFNGTAAGYEHAPLTAKAGERVRIWAVSAGPGSGLALHVVGAPFDAVYKEGAYLLGRDDPGGAQVLDLAPAQGGFAELTFPEPGRYPVLDHDMRHAEGGARGVFEVGAP